MHWVLIVLAGVYTDQIAREKCLRRGAVVLDLGMSRPFYCDRSANVAR